MSAPQYLDWSEFLPHQWDFFSWEPDDPARIQQTVEFLGGGWGAGKTEGAARRFFKLCCENPWTEAYGDGNPTAIVAAPTLRVLKQATMATLEGVIPREAILKKRAAPHYEWILVNGVRILFTSGEAEMEGISAFACWIDEVQHPAFSSDPRRYLNYMARLRDPHSKRRAMIASGLPESGWVRDTFDRPDDPAYHTVLAATADNVHIPAELMERFRGACPSGYEGSLLEGRWMSPPGAIYSQYNAAIHLTEMRGKPHVAVDVGMDVGNGAHVVFAQPMPMPARSIAGRAHGTQKGLLFVDEMAATNLSVDEICMRIKAERGHWRIEPGVSTIHVDPNTDRDERRALYKHFPGVRIVRKERGDETYAVETGIRFVQAALLDSWGNARILFWRGLTGTYPACSKCEWGSWDNRARPDRCPKCGAPLRDHAQYGVIDAVQRYRRNEATGKPIKDNLRDHACDAFRYVVAEQLPLERAEARVIRHR
ncbi:MAG: hypothetical protein RMA76_38190 [Deltaproteobacteria bacterium]